MKIKGVVGLFLAAAFCASFSACDFAAMSKEEDGSGKSAYEIAVENGFQGSEEDWLLSLKGEDGKDGTTITIADLYEEWLAQGNSGSYNEFLKEYLSYDLSAESGYDVDILQHNLLSTVSVYCAFSVKTIGETGSKNALSAGSGVIVDLDKENGNATVITNYHVVYDVDSTEKISKDICLYLYGGRAGYDEDGSLGGVSGIHASYVGGAMNYDIAVLRVENSEILKQSVAEEAKIGDSETLTVGERVFAIGNAEGEGISVTEGVLSVESESIDLTAADEKSTVSFRVMRTDAALNHGNSGGPLFNAKGQLIGINNAKKVEEEVDAMGYSLPITQVMYVVENLLDNGGVVRRAMFGITVETVDSKAVWDEQRGRVKIVETIRVAEIVKGSISENKFEVGDKILSIQIADGEKKEVERNFHVIDRMLSVRLNDTVKVTVLRNGQEETLSFTFDKWNYFTSVQ